MKKILGLFILYAILCIHTINTFASVRIEGGHSTKASLKEKSNVECYIVSSAGNSVLFFEGPANSTVKKYHTKADDAEIINGARYENGAWRIDNPEMNCGYILELPRGLTEYYWLLEYNTADFEKEKISVYDDPNDPCNYIRIKVDGGFSSWMIKAPNGKNIAVDRQFHIRYKDLKYNEESEKFYAIDKDEYIGVIDGELQLFSPLMDTDFTLVGDNYNEALQITFKEIKSNVFLAKRMELHTYIKVESEQKSNNEGEL